MMKYVKWIVAFVFAISLIPVVMITAVEIAVYADYGYFEKEYIKYDVNAEGSIVDMEMDELMEVTKEMMSYLRGNRKDLVVYAIIDGEETEFFNDIEKFHMNDVRNLFVAALYIRRICLFFMLSTASVLFMLNAGVLKTLSKMVIWVMGIFDITFVTLIGLISLNFNRAFTIFHEILFTNDMWLLDPDTDRLINIVPEGFFVDTAIRIAVIYFLINFIIFSIAFLILCGKIKWIKRKNTLTQDGGTYEQG
ncbi:MAG: TIGR01906 family membrane protein [Lachnospiraceae bacterium]|nr:TIGR01906 family membrane protein [Lachnospiraceae bacterium]